MSEQYGMAPLLEGQQNTRNLLGRTCIYLKHDLSVYAICEMRCAIAKSRMRSLQIINLNPTLSRVHTARGTAQLSSTDLLLSCAVPRGTAQCRAATRSTAQCSAALRSIIMLVKCKLYCDKFVTCWFQGN